MLQNLITWLEKHNPDLIVPYGFGAPDSYRGNYMDVAFEPVENARIGDMLQHARAALGATFYGWKGGEFTMHGLTDCWIAHPGECSDDKIGHLMLKLWELLAYHPPYL